MTIQPSILIWTVISFAVLMLVLDRLLFRPILSFMDERNKKIDKSKEARRVSEEKREEAERLMTERAAEAENIKDEIIAREIVLAHEHVRLLHERAEEERNTRLKEQQLALNEYEEKLEAELNGRVEELAMLFADKLVS